MSADPRRVLMVAYFFPPMGGGGVMRALKLARYLPETGWLPEVLSADDPRYLPRDPDGLSEVHCPVFRVPARRLPSLARLLKRSRPPGAAPSGGGGTDVLRTNLHRRAVALGELPDLYIPWVAPARSAVAALAASRRYDLLWTTGPPFSALLLGPHLKRLHDIPWVIDLRDCWTTGPFFRPPTPLHRALHRRWESRALRRADAVVCATPGMASLYRRAYPDIAERVHVITNGFDEADFTGLPTSPPTGDVVTIGYAGSFYGPRRPDAFLEALAMVRRRRPGTRLRFLQFGTAGPEALRALDAFAAAHPEAIERPGSLTHHESLAALNACELLLLLIGRQPGAQTIMTGKLFEYLRLGKPILACCPPGDAADLVRRLNAGVVAPPDDAGAIARALEGLLDNPPPPPAAVEIEAFNRVSLAGGMAEIFNSLL